MSLRSRPRKLAALLFCAERGRQPEGESPFGPRMRSNAPFLSRSISGERSVSAFDKRIGLRRATFLGSAWIDVGFANLGKLGVGGFLFIQGFLQKPGSFLETELLGESHQ